MGPWKFCTGLPDRHGFESHVRHTVVSASQCFALTGIGKYGLGAANFLPECTHDMVWYTMVKTTKKKIETLSLSLQEIVTCRSIKTPPGYTRKCRAHRLAKKSKRCLCLCKKLSTEQEVSIRASGYIRENAVHTALRKKKHLEFRIFFCTRRPRLCSTGRGDRGLPQVQCSPGPLD